MHSQKIIFISGRFRSGTSMLWNVFNQLPQYCAWYEPLHPNLLSHIAYVKPKKDHLGIDDYWSSYSGLKNLQHHYSSEFGQKNLYLEQHKPWPELKQYLHYLIDNSQHKIPVLQFNRMDLRLAWLKNNFPQSTLITINREPFPLWVSQRKHITDTHNKTLESYPDAYDLLQWSVDLATSFPLLQAQEKRHGYFRHYFIDRLSQLMGASNTNLSLNLELDFHQGNFGLAKIAKHFNWDKESFKTASKLIHKPKSLLHPLEKPEQIVDVENEINHFFEVSGLDKNFPSCLLSAIKHEHKKAWDKPIYSNAVIVQELLTAMRYQKDELTRRLP